MVSDPLPAGADAVIGLGANLGAPELALAHAVEDLAAIGELVAVSGLYATLPVGGPPQPDFLNAAVRLRFTGTPTDLLQRLLAVERAAGRERRVRWGPRTLDLDILWIAGVCLKSPQLEIPHPRLRQRPFALVPLLDVAPDAVDPVDQTPYARVLGSLDSSGVRRLRQAWLDDVARG